MTSQKIFFLLLFLLSIGLFAYTLTPFFAVIVLGFVASAALRPAYVRLVQYYKGRESLAAGTIILVLIISIFSVIGLLGAQLANQAQNVYEEITQNSTMYSLNVFSDQVNEFIAPYTPGYTFTIEIEKYVRPVISFVAENIGSVLSGTASVIFKFFLWLVTIYFILRDGDKLQKIIHKLSPLKDEYDTRIIERASLASQSIVKGIFLIALVQGFLVGLGLFVVGIENAVFWGFVAAISAPIPLLGTSVILIPSIIYLIVTSQFGMAALLIAWGGVVVGTIDNVLTPYLYSRGTEIHALILLFSILGGLAMFGPIGFIVGPLISTLALTLIDLYQEIVLEEKV